MSGHVDRWAWLTMFAAFLATVCAVDAWRSALRAVHAR
jgi:hypothetical protein